MTASATRTCSASTATSSSGESHRSRRHDLGADMWSRAASSRTCSANSTSSPRSCTATSGCADSSVSCSTLACALSVAGSRLNLTHMRPPPRPAVRQRALLARPLRPHHLRPRVLLRPLGSRPRHHAHVWRLQLQVLRAVPRARAQERAGGRVRAADAAVRGVPPLEPRAHLWGAFLCPDSAPYLPHR